MEKDKTGISLPSQRNSGDLHVHASHPLRHPHQAQAVVVEPLEETAIR